MQGSELTLVNSQNKSDFDKVRVRKYPLANICKLESSMPPKHLKRICQTLQVYWKVNFESWNV